MLTCHVVVSRQSDRSAPCPPLPATSHVTKFPVVHPLSIQQVTKCFFRNSFVLRAIHFEGGGVYPAAGSAPRPSSPRLPIPHSLSPIPFVFTFFRTHLHFFALIKNSTLFFSSDSALCVKKRPGVGYPSDFFRGPKSTGHGLTTVPSVAPDVPFIVNQPAACARLARDSSLILTVSC